MNLIPPTPVVSSSSSICEGSPLNLSASSIAGASYSWTGPNGFTNSQQNVTIANATLAASGTYSVTATLNGCTSIEGNETVTVNPIPLTPIITNNSPLCEGSTLNLSASTIAGASYSWTGPNGFTNSMQNVTIANATLAASGAYSVKATLNGCTSQNGISSVVVNSLPISPVVLSNSPVCSGSSILLNAASMSGATYNWSGPNGFTSTQQNPVITNPLFL